MMQSQRGSHMLYDVISAIRPGDVAEQRDIEDLLMWVQSGQPLFRVARPDVPSKHVCAYFVLYDEYADKLLMMDHKHAQLWLPPGGHVEVNEHPMDTVRRECYEELGVAAHFWRSYPIFIAPTYTVGHTAGHVDVNIWYVLRGDVNATYHVDTSECNALAWFALDEIPFEATDVHMRRFVAKLRAITAGNT